MLVEDQIDRGLPSGATTFFASLATFAKSFVPFQFFGSTFVFSACFVLCLATATLDARNSLKSLYRSKTEIALLCALLVVAAGNYSFLSAEVVPITYVAGAITFSLFFLLLGAVASDRADVIAGCLIAAACIYFLFVVKALVLTGDLYSDGNFADIFGLERTELSSGSAYTQLYQNVGAYVALGAISAFALSTRLPKREQLIVQVTSCLLASILMAYVESRGALLGFFTSIAYLAGFRIRSVTVAVLFLVIPAALLIAAFYGGIERIPIVTRTINEIYAAENTPTRIAIMSFIGQSFIADPTILLFGRGFGRFPVDYGYNAPDWLLASPSASLYPHNPIVEACYELGLAGAAIYVALIAAPLVRYWRQEERPDLTFQIVFAFYLYFLFTEMVSGSLAYSYVFYFFLGGVSALTSRTGSAISRRSP